MIWVRGGECLHTNIDTAQLQSTNINRLNNIIENNFLYIFLFLYHKTQLFPFQFNQI